MALDGVMEGAVAEDLRSLGRWRDDEVEELAESLREYMLKDVCDVCVCVADEVVMDERVCCWLEMVWICMCISS